MLKLLWQVPIKPEVPTADFSGKTVIVTGANVGLGKEAVKHFVRQGASKVIATARSSAKGAAALTEIEVDTKRPGIAEFWDLDYGNYASVKSFCARVAKLDRLDAVVLNAGVATTKFELYEGDESSVTVNVISTMLLCLLLLPILREQAKKWAIVPTLAITGSEIHTWAKFQERNAPNSLAALSDPKTTTMEERYAFLSFPVSPFHLFSLSVRLPSRVCNSFFHLHSYQDTKLLQLLVVRELAARTADKKPFVIVNTINPGLCVTSLGRDAKGSMAFFLSAMYMTVAWTAEQGARTLFHATVAGPKSHGVMLDCCKIEK